MSNFSPVAERNRRYLHLIFNHSKNVINDVLKSSNENYPQAYDELVRREGHGTPGAVRRSSDHVPRMPQLTSTSQTKNSPFLEDRERRRIKRAEELIESFEKYESSATEYWRSVWGDDYRGFRETQKEIGVLRDDILKGTSKEGTSKYTLVHLRNELNYMLRSSVSEWYKLWGELDLHRLSTRDALELIRIHLKQPPWNEMRIVAGQRQHRGDDHSSEGILYNLIRQLFGKRVSDKAADYNDIQKSIIRDIQRFAKENAITSAFYSNDAAVCLRRPRQNRSRAPSLVWRR